MRTGDWCVAWLEQGRGHRDKQIHEYRIYEDDHKKETMKQKDDSNECSEYYCKNQYTNNAYIYKQSMEYLEHLQVGFLLFETTGAGQHKRQELATYEKAQKSAQTNVGWKPFGPWIKESEGGGTQITRHSVFPM